MYTFEVEYERDYTENNFIITQRCILWIESYWEDLIACRPQSSDCELVWVFWGHVPGSHLVRRHRMAVQPKAL